MTALQIEDIGQCIERYTQGIFCQSGIQEEVVA